ncbi:C-C chemokine receptor-like 2 isoform X1 [Camelus dromedarius]|uniref:C-C chemokine receptor-like 2 isoform X1 n=1 Tax=Camelus dromedarius TaxID=9838 RepID=UPI00311A5E99
MLRVVSLLQALIYILREKNSDLSACHRKLLQRGNSLKMANYTSAPEDEYDVLIEDNLTNNEIEPCTSYDPKILLAQLVPHLYTTLFMVGLLDNILAVLILVKYKGLKYVENIYFLNLAIANLCFVLTLPFWAYTASHGGVLGNPLCKTLVVFYSIGLYSEAFFNALLTVQTYCKFFDVRFFSASRTVAGSTITMAWVVAVLVTLPELVFYKPQLESQEYKCFLSRPHFLPADETFWKHFLTLKMNILGFLLPLFVFVVCYMRMRKTPRFREARHDIFKLVFTIMVVFLLMWGPYNIALFLSAFNEHFSLHDCNSSYNLDKSVQITKIIATIHCCVNPLLYVFLDNAFREHLRRHLCCLCDDTAPQPTEEYAQDTSRGEHHLSTNM